MCYNKCNVNVIRQRKREVKLMLRSNILRNRGTKSPFSPNYKSDLPYAALRQKQMKDTKERMNLNAERMIFLSI